VALLVVVMMLWIVEEPSGSTGIVHPDFGAMQRSGPDITFSQSIQWMAISFGCLIALILITCVILGFLRQDRLAPDRKPLLWIGAGYILIYAGMVIAYLDYSGSDSPIYFLGFPLPTAWMIYLFWLFPAAFSIYYVWKFDRWVFKPTSMEEFRSLVKGVDVEENNTIDQEMGNQSPEERG
jgi:hypothetical protein